MFSISPTIPLCFKKGGCAGDISTVGTVQARRPHMHSVLFVAEILQIL